MNKVPIVKKKSVIVTGLVGKILPSNSDKSVYIVEEEENEYFLNSSMVETENQFYFSPLL